MSRRGKRDREPASPVTDELEDEGTVFSNDSRDEDDFYLDTVDYSDEDTESDESDDESTESDQSERGRRGGARKSAAFYSLGGAATAGGAE